MQKSKTSVFSCHWNKPFSGSFLV